MASLLTRYTHWLHTRWPAGTVEKLPACDEHGRTNLPGVRIVGDLTGVPLLKFSSDSGARAVREIAAELGEPETGNRKPETLDLAIIGGGVAGISAAIEARRAGLNFAVFEATQVFSTVANFPKAKPIFTYPTDMQLDGGLHFTADVKEALLAEMEAQRRAAGIEVTPARIERLARDGETLVLKGADGDVARAQRVIVAIGRSGNHRKLGVPGEELGKVFNRLHDPKEYAGKNVLVVGGGDSALETAIALGACGAHVTLSYRKKEFARPKPGNIENLHALAANPDTPVEIRQPTNERASTALIGDMQRRTPTGSVQLRLGSAVTRLDAATASLRTADGTDETLPNDVVFTMLGREAPLDFFRRSGLPIRGEWTPGTWASFIAFFLFCTFVYLWKGGTSLKATFERNHWFPFNVPDWLHSLGGNIAAQSADPSTILGTLAITATEPGFYYSVAYTAIIIIFGVRRIRRRRTPYVTTQTLTLMAVQTVPLFLLPYFILPYAGHNGFFDHGFARTVADGLFPLASYAHGREYWRSFGFILAWPLFFWNLATAQPLWWWLAISGVQTFVIIPLIVWRWGKGAYCGWICSCGALAETLGDTHREKMPHGPRWNRLNMVGQVALALISLVFLFRVLAWLGVPFAENISGGLLGGWSLAGLQLNYYHVVDLGLAGIVGVAAYFWFSGRVWCRFACPLAALMHIYARFSRYRIFAEKKKCISCNVCTSVCHQGIDVMNFANKGLPMEDPECVRCSACVQQCPTGVLSFGRLGDDGIPLLDQLAASPVRMRENAAVGAQN